MSDCPRLGRIFGGCEFSPRYDVGPPTIDMGEFSGGAAGILAIVETSKPRTYVRDVCQRCGKTVERGA